MLQRIIHKIRLPLSFIRFLIVGVANTAVGLTVIWVTRNLLHAGNTLANTLGYVVGITVSFFLNRNWSFSFRGDRGRSLLRFLLVFAVAYAANLVTVLALVELTESDSFWYQVCGVAPYSMLFYLGCRWYAFPVDGRLSARCVTRSKGN